MIQCVGCRQEGRDYCARVCCSQAVKNALALKKQRPERDVAMFAPQVVELAELLLLAVDQQQVFHWGVFTAAMIIQGTPNRSVSMPNSSPHICFSNGIVT